MLNAMLMFSLVKMDDMRILLSAVLLAEDATMAEEAKDDNDVDNDDDNDDHDDGNVSIVIIIVVAGSL